MSGLLSGRGLWEGRRVGGRVVARWLGMAGSARWWSPVRAGVPGWCPRGWGVAAMGGSCIWCGGVVGCGGVRVWTKRVVLVVSGRVGGPVRYAANGTSWRVGVSRSVRIARATLAGRGGQLRGGGGVSLLGGGELRFDKGLQVDGVRWRHGDQMREDVLVRWR